MWYTTHAHTIATLLVTEVHILHFTTAESNNIERLHVTSHVQVVVYSLGLTVLIYGTLAYLRMKLFLKAKLTDAE